MNRQGVMIMYEVVVVGAGHAGVEAALASARIGHKTALITLNIDTIAMMPCNPSVGGPAKGIVVREIEALGGQMGKTADKTALQFKMLNTNKGPGVQSLRVQSDKVAYSSMMKDEIVNQENLVIEQEMVIEIICKDQVIVGVACQSGRFIECKALILTTGTYMSSKVMVSDHVKESGPDGLPTTKSISASIRSLGLETFRLKTGTPPRVRTNTVNFSETALQPGDENPVYFSRETRRSDVIDVQYPCYLTYTNQGTHELILQNLNRSSMYSGVVEGVGPRYCPSIEDKIVRFSDKERHQLFLEPESAELDTTYIQGFSSSLPEEVQEKMVHSIKGLEHCVIEKYAYAIEYDAIKPTQLKPSLETKTVQGLFCAGQINGTSGYEEAAGQGIIAGINASKYIKKEPPLILGRDEAYIGVMIDDLVTKGTKEPYRLLTSRSEYRLLLRHDNAYRRLSGYGYQAGLIKAEDYTAITEELLAVDRLIAESAMVHLPASDELNTYLAQKNYEPLQGGMSLKDLVKRPHVMLGDLLKISGRKYDAAIVHQAEVEIKYEGYISKAKKDAEKLKQMDVMLIPEHLNYDEIMHLSLEGRQKLSEIRPRTIGQASRISGVNPADISVLALAIQHYQTPQAGA